MYKKLLLIGLLLVSVPSLSQSMRMFELLQYMDMSAKKFESSMLRKDFICYQNQRTLWGWTCLFAYQPALYPVSPEKATALIKCDHNSRSDAITYQIHSLDRFQTLENELVRLGYVRQPVLKDRRTYSRNNVLVTCQQTDNRNGMSGNYTGHTITVIRRRY